MQTKNRIYALDTIRATMMLIVVFAHAGLTYAVTNFGSNWPIKDPHNTNALFDFLAAFTQSTCMSVLFTVSGFLAAMLFIERGPEKMILNRLKRIVLPLAIGLLLIYPVVVLIFSYFILTTTHQVNTFSALIETFNNAAWKNFNTMHLWYLYFLSFFCVGGWGISLLCKKISPKISATINAGFGAIFRLKLAPVLFAVATYLLFCVQRKGFIDTYLGFSIITLIIVQHAVFFAFGWLLYHQKEHIDRFKKNDRLFAIIGTLLFIIHIGIFAVKPGIEKTSGLYIFAALKALSLWFLVFGIIGLFLRGFNTYSPVARYMSDASYWIYIAHLPVVMFFQVLLINFDLNAFIKFLIVISATFIVVLITYNFMVRNTFIGKFLNGKKYAPGLSNANQAKAGSLSV